MRAAKNNNPSSFFFLLNPPWRHGGFTLTEVVIALALVALVAVGVVKGVELMTTSSSVSTAVSKLTQAAHGINEYRLLTKRIPTGTDWTPLNDFVDSNIRNEHSYRCDAGTGNRVVITTTYTFSSSPKQKLEDRGVCTSSSAYNTDKTFTCYLAVFANDSCS